MEKPRAFEHSFPLCGGLLQHLRAVGLKMQAGLHDPKLASSAVSMMEVGACSLRRRGKQDLAAFKRTNTKAGELPGEGPRDPGELPGEGPRDPGELPGEGLHFQPWT